MQFWPQGFEALPLWLWQYASGFLNHFVACQELEGRKLTNVTSRYLAAKPGVGGYAHAVPRLDLLSTSRPNIFLTCRSLRTLCLERTKQATGQVLHKA